MNSQAAVYTLGTLAGPRMLHNQAISLCFVDCLTLARAVISNDLCSQTNQSSYVVQEPGFDRITNSRAEHHRKKPQDPTYSIA